jgi:outer membrane protein OmpA-like peptidoglycan-associated protein
MIARHEGRPDVLRAPTGDTRRPSPKDADAERSSNPAWRRLALTRSWTRSDPGTDEGIASSAGIGVCPVCGRRGHGRCSGCGHSFEPDDSIATSRIQRSPLADSQDVGRIAEPVEAYVRRSVGTGSPLPVGTKRTLEQAYGADLGGVHVRADTAAAGAAAALRARAFTLGGTIWFGQGEYRPDSAAGWALLAHEVAHTVQAGAGRHPFGSRIELGETNDSEETAARGAATAAAMGRPASGLQRDATSALIRRVPIGESADEDRGARLWSLMSRGRLVIDGFPHDEATLTAANASAIESHAATLLELLGEDPGGRVAVTGHTDATGTSGRNEILGIERATAVRDRLVAAGVPVDRISIASVAARELAVDTAGPEPANRRAVVGFLPALRLAEGSRPTFGLGIPPRSPGAGSAPPTGGSGSYELPRGPSLLDIDMCAAVPDLCLPGPRPPSAGQIFRPVPPPPARTADGLRSFFERDPLLRLLPPALRSRAIDGLMRVDEAIAGAIVGEMDLDPTARRALTETLRALLRYMKGERWTPPPAPPPSRLPPDFGSHRFPRAPGERIFTLPPFRF